MPGESIDSTSPKLAANKNSQRLHSKALSSLYNALSIAFSYPDATFYQELKNGRFYQVLSEAIGQLPITNTIPLLQPLQDGIKHTLRCGLESLQSDYLSLFELNREQAPTHLYAHLYDDRQREQVSLLRQLQDFYHSCGLSLKSVTGIEQPDHLTIELEFMAYLLSKLQVVDPLMAAKKTEQEVIDFYQELRWIHKLVETLDSRTTHPFYLPLAHFMSAVLRSHTV